VTETKNLFELELQLPDDGLRERSTRLIGFEARYERLQRDLRLLAAPDELRDWSLRFYDRELPVVAAVGDRYPLVIFGGDVGTGKTATAEAACDRLARERKKDAMLFKLSTRVRGEGKVGQMSTLINHAFESVVREAGKARSSFLIIDEADSLTASRDDAHSHHEDRVAVNTVIQRVDDLRRHGGRILVFLCTNRAAALDPAITRRAARVEVFARPDAGEREALLRMDLEGIDISDGVIHKVVDLTGLQKTPARPGFTFSDLRSRLIPEALGHAFPDRALEADDLIRAARDLLPSPVVSAG
jgi:AAA+ superfamily predicted ATPase